MIKEKVVLEMSREKFKFFLDADNTIERKASSLLGFEVAIITGYVGLFLQNMAGSNLNYGILSILFLIGSAYFLLRIV